MSVNTVIRLYTTKLAFGNEIKYLPDVPVIVVIKSVNERLADAVEYPNCCLFEK